jgi:hypothetical protein
MLVMHQVTQIGATTHNTCLELEPDPSVATKVILYGIVCALTHKLFGEVRICLDVACRRVCCMRPASNSKQLSGLLHDTMFSPVVCRAVIMQVGVLKYKQEAESAWWMCSASRQHEGLAATAASRCWCCCYCC